MAVASGQMRDLSAFKAIKVFNDVVNAVPGVFGIAKFTELFSFMMLMIQIQYVSFHHICAEITHRYSADGITSLAGFSGKISTIATNRQLKTVRTVFAYAI